MKRITHILVFLTLVLPMHARGSTHFAYNSVDRVAAGEGIVYGVSSGALFSVETQSEKIRTYSAQDGLHGSDIACVQWLKPTSELMIVYADGKMDILSDGKFYYVPDLYSKYTTQSKRCHSVTVRDSIAYLAMDYGVQTFNIRRRTLDDTYFIGSEGKEVPVYSIALTAQAIYAAGESVLYAASLDDNMVGYSYWSTVALPEKGQIQGIAQVKGALYLLINQHCYRRAGNQWQVYSGQQYNVLNVVDDNIYPAEYPSASCSGIWQAAGEEGLIRTMNTGERVTYRLDGAPANAGGNTAENSELIDYGSMLQWTVHNSYTNIEDFQLSSKRVYALSSGSLCAIDRSDDAIVYYSKLNGLSGSFVHRIDYDMFTHMLIISYDDGMIDLMDDNENVTAVADLYTKTINVSKQVQDVAFRDGRAYMAMPFGILVMNIRKHEISDTYYIGDKGSEVFVNAIALAGDSIYAAVGNKLYSAGLNAAIEDYAKWHSQTFSGKITHLQDHEGNLYMLVDSALYRDRESLNIKERFVGFKAYQGNLFASTADKRIFQVTSAAVDEVTKLSSYSPSCAVKENNDWWMCTLEGFVHLSGSGALWRFFPDGPSSNMPYALTTSGSNLWMVEGGRWSEQYWRPGRYMFYDGTSWTNVTHSAICERIGDMSLSLYDFGHVAVDPANPAHFFISCFGTGLIEFLADGTAKHYRQTNSPLVSLVEGSDYYCRVDALTFDPEGNLWLTNTGPEATNIHVIDPSHKWHSFNLKQSGRRIELNTVSKFLVDNRNASYKWIASARANAGLILHYDHDTPYIGSDDKAIMRSSFVDQDGKGVSIKRLNTIAQDYNGDLWLGTDEGIVVIKAETDMFTSDLCHRLKMSRHDGTGLADYLLGTEQINAIVFAGANRIWIGTETSGVYLVRMVTNDGIYEPDILAHFTSQNSPMPSDGVQSIAIDDRGEVYIGTFKGLVSYRGDAMEAKESYADAYVYPNPVRPNFEGTITIAGLMDNTTVYIADAAGNVVCRTHSNGGIAVWDGKTQSGKKAHSGVYTVYCNTADGKNHTTLKLMLMH